MSAVDFASPSADIDGEADIDISDIIESANVKGRISSGTRGEGLYMVRL